MISHCCVTLSSTHIQLSNGYDHHHHQGPSAAPYLSGEVYPDLPPSSPSTPLASSSYSPTSPVWAWSRPGSALLVDYPPYCALGPGMIPSSKVPTWKVRPFCHQLPPPLPPSFSPLPVSPVGDQTLIHFSNHREIANTGYIMLVFICGVSHTA